MSRTTLTILTILLSGMLSESKAQGKSGAFIGGGTMWYQGDLNETPLPHPMTMRWTANAGLWWQIHQRWALQLNYTAGEVWGDDEFASTGNNQARALKFQSFIHEIGIRGTYDILRNDKWNFLPFITVGLAALNFEPKRDTVALRALQTEGVSYGNWSVAFPLGLGAKYQFDCNWALKLEANYHLILTDYLDDVSGDYPATEVSFYSDPGNVSDTRDLRGNPSTLDGMWDINLGVVYFFTGCTRKNIYEDCKELNKGVDMDMLLEMYK
jgi:opacity protein-like surface antigen